MPIRLAIVDGHTLTRYGLRELASKQPDMEVVAECGSAAEAPRVVSMAEPDVVTVDVGLPDGDGLQLAREFRDRSTDLGIVILTSQDKDDVMFRALETGMSAFVAKTAPVEEVLGSIRHAAVAASSFTASGLAVALARRHTGRERLALSPREMEVLRRLCDGLSIPAIALTMFISQSTTKTYVARLYEKLGAANRAQAVMMAVQQGLIDHAEAAFSRPAPTAGAGGPASAAAAAAGRDNQATDRPAAADRSQTSPRPTRPVPPIQRPLVGHRAVMNRYRSALTLVDAHGVPVQCVRIPTPRLGGPPRR
jgi:DNA-binding NarL/FixJ family response regulator